MSTGVYEGGDVSQTGGRYRELSRDELQRMGVADAMLRDDRTGFAAKVYRGADGSTVLSFRGSDGIDPTDFGGTNIPNGIGLPVAQGAGHRAAQRVAAGVGAENLTLTGHSLGGHLAVVGSVATESPGRHLQRRTR